MLLKVIAEGPFSYVSNGFNVFDGVIVVLRWDLTSLHFTSLHFTSRLYFGHQPFSTMPCNILTKIVRNSKLFFTFRELFVAQDSRGLWHVREGARNT
jgi:voltage-dependent calcium channel T type alpha-1G